MDDNGGRVVLPFSASLNFPNIPAGEQAELTITCTGATVGMPVAPAWPATLEAGLGGMMFVSATNTVTVRLTAVAAGDIDPATQTFGGMAFS